MAQTAAVTLMTVGALALLAVILAHWTWQWLAPLPESRGQPVTSETGRVPSASSLFGKAEQEHGNVSPTGTGIRLLGIVAATTGRNGYAVLRMEPRTIITVREGEDIAPGLRLAEVARDHVILQRGELRETLGWPAVAATAAPAALRPGK